MDNDLERLNNVIMFLKHDGIIKSQGDIAKDLGYSRQASISDIVNGKSPITPKFLKAFCTFYGVNEGYITHGKGKPFKDDDPRHTSADSVFKRYLQGNAKILAKIDQLEKGNNEPSEFSDPIYVAPRRVSKSELDALKLSERKEKHELASEIEYLKQIRNLLSEKTEILARQIEGLLNENNEMRNQIAQMQDELTILKRQSTNDN